MEASIESSNNLELNKYDVEKDDERTTGSATKKEEGGSVTGMSLTREIVLVAVVSMAQFSTQVGVGGTLAILHIIGDDLSITKNGELSWLMAAYSLTVGSFILPAGRLGDVFGYKKMLLFGFSWFTLWTLVAGLSVYSNHVLFNFARTLQGIGPAICLPNGLAVLGSTYPPGQRKNIVFSIFGATAPLGSVLGATFASLFALAWWPWAFFSFAIVLAATAIAGELIIPAPTRRTDPNQSAWHKFCQLDPLGSTTGVTSLVLIDFAWNQGAVVGWQEPYVIVALILGILLIPVFLYVEAYVVSAPLLPAECMNSDIGTILACVACGWSCFGIFLFYIWQFFELLRHASPLMASAWYSTNAVSGAGAAILTGLFLDRVGPPLAMVLALLAYVVGTILLATAPVDQIYWAQSFLCLLIIPFGMDISFPAATVILSNAVPKEHQGIGASLVNTVVNFSISLGLGFAGVVEVHVNNGGNSPEEMLRGYRGAWYMGIGLSGLGLTISVLYWMKVLFKQGKKQ
ncbi:hypothetical protein OEA41_008593 [Lepraria neglecta]|uniref:Major facilitator superfamily (MFS) profile domain-containing protein n=1 Tax=Lepraria neglecta TaxID=209136 RepID=A0AAE0DHB0_9LECA|nr:hypothetical protein OEA41_008593 [Lepraria neglecta]